MTRCQAELLRQLIGADRRYRSRRAAGLPASADDRGVEIGLINGVDPRTARALVEAGLAEALNIGRNSSSWLFLGAYEPFDEVG